MPSEYKVLCAVGVHIDEVLRLNVAARPGESIPAVRETGVGGCAFNVAAALSAAGHAVSHAGLRGSFDEGLAAHENDVRTVGAALEAHGVEEIVGRVPLSDEAHTGVGRYVAMLNPDGTLALAAAAMEAYAEAGRLAAHPPYREAAETADLLVLDANASAEHCQALAEARGTDTRLALLATSAGKAPNLASLVREADIVFANEAEWSALGAPSVKLAFVTRGQGGASVIENGRETASLPSRARRVASVIGAGDAFAAGTLDAWLRGAEPVVAMDRGLECAALCVERPDALSWLDAANWSSAGEGA